MWCTPQCHLFLHLILEYFPSRTGLSLLRLKQCKVLSVFCMRLYEVNIWISKELGYYIAETETFLIIFCIIMSPLWYSHQSWHSKIGNVMLPQIQLNKKCLLLNFNNQSCEEASQERLLLVPKSEKNLSKVNISRVEPDPSHKSEPKPSWSQAICPALAVSHFLMYVSSSSCLWY